MSQADPRTEPIISFIGVSDLPDEETTAFPTSKKQEITEIEQQLKREDTTRKEAGSP